MSLKDYSVLRDHFCLHPLGVNNPRFSFPCCVCRNQERGDHEEPCRSCDHNCNSVKDNAEASGPGDKAEFAAPYGCPLEATWINNIYYKSRKGRRVKIQRKEDLPAYAKWAAVLYFVGYVEDGLDTACHWNKKGECSCAWVDGRWSERRHPEFDIVGVWDNAEGSGSSVKRDSLPRVVDQNSEDL